MLVMFFFHVITNEIDYALKYIDDTKAPDIGGFYNLFLKKNWHFIKP